LQGHIGNNSPRPDYKQAELYLRQAASHGYSNALCKLGYLYLEGYIGTIDGNPDYKSAVKCLEEAAQSSDLPAKSNAFYNLGVLHVKGHVNHNGLPNYGRAVDCFMQSTMPEASYNIGNLYEEGYVKGAGYNEALEYYKKSNLPRAQIAMLGLYQLGRVKPKNENDKQEIIEDIVQKINPLLPTLPLEESYYIKGIAEYYLGNWEEAFISLQNALFLGNEEEGLSRLIEEIEEALEGQGEQERELKQKSSFPIPAIPTLEKKIEEIPEGKKEQKETMELPPEPGKETKQESNFPISTITPIKKETRENKISLIKGKVNKSKQSIFKPKKIKQKFLGFQRDTELKTPKLPQLPLRFQFLNHEDQDNFENLRKSNRKLQEILQDIEENCWATAGSGRPEVLKYPFKEHKYPFTEHKGCLSRRLNQGDRLVYKVIKPGVILVLSWEGHY
jgi:Txe/YoeB family toxin of Txe-Axe toxin-antitoxin module